MVVSDPSDVCNIHRDKHAFRMYTVQDNMTYKNILMHSNNDVINRLRHAVQRDGSKILWPTSIQLVLCSTLCQLNLQNMLSLALVLSKPSGFTAADMYTVLVIKPIYKLIKNQIRAFIIRRLDYIS